MKLVPHTAASHTGVS